MSLRKSNDFNHLKSVGSSPKFAFEFPQTSHSNVVAAAALDLALSNFGVLQDATKAVNDSVPHSMDVANTTIQKVNNLEFLES